MWEKNRRLFWSGLGVNGEIQENRQDLKTRLKPLSDELASSDGESLRSQIKKATRLTKERFISMAHAAIAVAGSRLLLGIRLSFHNHAPQQLFLYWQFINLQPIRSGATSSAGRQKKAWVSAGKSLARGWVAMGMATKEHQAKDD